MPVVFRSGPYRFFFYSGDWVEPPHVHVWRDAQKAKFWLRPVILQKNTGFSQRELNKIRQLIESNEGYLLEQWDDYFSG